MSTWFTENPIGVYLVLAVLAGLMSLVFFTSGRVKHLVGVILCLLLGVGVWLIDTLVVTDREAIQQRSLALAAAIDRGDLATLEELISADYDPPPSGKAAIMARAKRYFLPGERRYVRFSQMGVLFGRDANRATLRCNASAGGNFGTFHVDPPYLGTMELFFQKEADGKWRVTGFKVYNTGGSEITVPN